MSTSCTLEEYPLFLNFMILSPEFPKSPNISSKKHFKSSKFGGFLACFFKQSPYLKVKIDGTDTKR